MPDRRQRSLGIVILVFVAVAAFVAFTAVSNEESVSEEFSPLFEVRVAYAAELEPIEVEVEQIFDNIGPASISIYSQPMECSVGEVQIPKAPPGDAEEVNSYATLLGPTCVSTCGAQCPTFSTCYTCVNTCVATMCTTCQTCWTTCEATCEATCLSCEPPCPMSAHYGW